MCEKSIFQCGYHTQTHSNLRMDSLAQVLNASNVRHNGRYLVVDGCSGLLTGAMLERLDG